MIARDRAREQQAADVGAANRKQKRGQHHQDGQRGRILIAHRRVSRRNGFHYHLLRREQLGVRLRQSGTLAARAAGHCACIALRASSTVTPGRNCAITFRPRSGRVISPAIGLKVAIVMNKSAPTSVCRPRKDASTTPTIVSGVALTRICSPTARASRAKSVATVDR
jgi:hypothetical protein